MQSKQNLHDIESDELIPIISLQRNQKRFVLWYKNFNLLAHLAKTLAAMDSPISDWSNVPLKYVTLDLDTISDPFHITFKVFHFVNFLVVPNRIDSDA